MDMLFIKTCPFIKHQMELIKSFAFCTISTNCKQRHPTPICAEVCTDDPPTQTCQKTPDCPAVFFWQANIYQTKQFAQQNKSYCTLKNCI